MSAASCLCRLLFLAPLVLLVYLLRRFWAWVILPADYDPDADETRNW